MGKLISLSGIDGAGKSTQVKLLANKLQNDGKLVNVGESMFTYFLLKPLVKVLRSATGSPGAGPVKRSTRLLPKFWFILSFFDIWASYIFYIRPKLAQYDYIIADRFYTDMWANLLYYGYLPNWAFGLIKFLPKADLSLVLLADPKQILTREQEFPPDYYFAQEKIYYQLAQNIKCTIIDANLKIQAVYAQILAALKS